MNKIIAIAIDIELVFEPGKTAPDSVFIPDKDECSISLGVLKNSEYIISLKKSNGQYDYFDMNSLLLWGVKPENYKTADLSWFGRLESMVYSQLEMFDSQWHKSNKVDELKNPATECMEPFYFFKRVSEGGRGESKSTKFQIQNVRGSTLPEKNVCFEFENGKNIFSLNSGLIEGDLDKEEGTFKGHVKLTWSNGVTIEGPWDKKEQAIKHVKYTFNDVTLDGTWDQDKGNFNGPVIRTLANGEVEYGKSVRNEDGIIKFEKEYVKKKLSGGGTLEGYYGVYPDGAVTFKGLTKQVYPSGMTKEGSYDQYPNGSYSFKGITTMKIDNRTIIEALHDQYDDGRIDFKGPGKKALPDGTVIEGVFDQYPDGKFGFKGPVKKTFSNGGTLEGNRDQYPDGMINFKGQAKETHKDGTVYEGVYDQYPKGKCGFKGSVKQTFPNGTIYEGVFDQYPNGKCGFKGPVKQTFPNGVTLEGERGKYPDGKVDFKGAVKQTFASGGTLEGVFDQYPDGKIDFKGPVKKTFSNGDVLEGEWDKKARTFKGPVKMSEELMINEEIEQLFQIGLNKRRDGC